MYYVIILYASFLITIGDPVSLEECIATVGTITSSYSAEDLERDGELPSGATCIRSDLVDE